jgi:hypothetical protein
MATVEGVRAERFERYGWVEFVGVLRFAQDDGQGQAKATADPPLQCGMTNKGIGNGNVLSRRRSDR